MKQLMKPSKSGVMTMPDKGKLDFGEMLLKEKLFKKGIDPGMITSEKQLDNIINTPTVPKSERVMPQKPGEVIQFPEDKITDWTKPRPTKKAYGGIAGMLGERTGFQVGGVSFAEFAPQLPANDYLGGSGQPNPQGGGGGEQQTLQGLQGLMSADGSIGMPTFPQYINEDDFKKAQADIYQQTGARSAGTMQQPLSGGAGDKTQSYLDFKKAIGKPGLNPQSRPENAIGPVVQLPGEPGGQPTQNLAPNTQPQATFNSFDQIANTALPNLNNVFPPPIPSYDTPEVSEEQKITDPYQRSESYKKQPAIPPEEEVRNRENSVTQAFGAQPGALGQALGLASGGIAGMLGEPTYADDNHRVPYKDAKLVDPGYFMHNKNRYEYNPNDPKNMRDFQEALEKLKNMYEKEGIIERKAFSETDKIPPENYLLEAIQNPETYFPTENTPEELKEIEKILRLKQEVKDGGRIGFGLGGFEKARRLFLKTMGAGVAGTSRTNNYSNS